MERVRLSEALEFSRVAYGMWRLRDDPDMSPDHVRAKIDACLEQGVTTIDQADIYGDYMAEELLGDCLKATPGLRDRIELVTKCGIVAPVGRHSSARCKLYDTSAGHIEESVDMSLKLMGTDRVDLLLIHRPDPFMDHLETGAALDALVAAGKALGVGVSNFRPRDFELLVSAMETPLVANQIELSLMANEAFTNGDLAFLQERGVRPMAWSPLGGGALASAAEGELTAMLDEVAGRNGTDRGAVAIAWLLAHPSGILPVMGSNALDRIRRFSDAFGVAMDRETWFGLYQAALGREIP